MSNAFERSRAIATFFKAVSDYVVYFMKRCCGGVFVSESVLVWRYD